MPSAGAMGEVPAVGGPERRGLPPSFGFQPCAKRESSLFARVRWLYSLSLSSLVILTYLFNSAPSLTPDLAPGNLSPHVPQTVTKLCSPLIFPQFCPHHISHLRGSKARNLDVIFALFFFTFASHGFYFLKRLKAEYAAPKHAVLA